jgi:hypothetical protein
MGRVLLWLLGVPVTVAVLFAVLGDHATVTHLHDNVTIASPGSDR